MKRTVTIGFNGELEIETETTDTFQAIADATLAVSRTIRGLSRVEVLYVSDENDSEPPAVEE